MPPLPPHGNQNNGGKKGMRDGTSRFATVHNDHDHGSRGDDEETPQPVARVLTFASTHDSSMSLLTTDSNQKRPAESSPDDESPSLVRQRKNPLPNFDLRPSDDDSVLSGDESDGWEAEEDKMLNIFSEQTRKEDELDNAALLECPPVACVEEWLELAGDGEQNLNNVAAAAAAAAAGGGMSRITKKSTFCSPNPH